MQENVRDSGSISELGKSPGVRQGNSLQYSHLGNPTDRGARQAVVHGVEKSRTQLSDSNDKKSAFIYVFL